jgi:DNA ligase (NAD+)
MDSVSYRVAREGGEKMQKRIRELTTILKRCRQLYYSGTSETGYEDVEYDHMSAELESLVAATDTRTPQSGSLKMDIEDAKSVLNAVGWSSSRGDMCHETPMLSLSNVYTADDCRRWIHRLEKRYGDALLQRHGVVVESKFDGVALAARYRFASKNRQVVSSSFSLSSNLVKTCDDPLVLVDVSSRGDGKVGDNVTDAVRCYAREGTLPSHFCLDDRDHARVDDNDDDDDVVVEVRGELVCSAQTFRERNADRSWSSPRSMVAAALHRNSADERLAGAFDFVAYALETPAARRVDDDDDDDDNDGDTHWRRLELLKSRGFYVDEHATLCATVDDVVDEVQRRASAVERERCGALPTDGLVLKVNSIGEQRRLDATMKAPRWALAFKWSGERGRTRIVDIDLQVSRSGRVTPVAVLDPLELDGATIRRATLHNFDFIFEHRLKRGDHVMIERVGSTIPVVVPIAPTDAVERKAACSSAERWIAEHVAAECPCRERAPLTVGAGPADVGVRVSCSAGAACPHRLIASLAHFASRRALDIGGLAAGTIRTLVDAKLVASSPLELLDLPALLASDSERRSELLALPGWAPRKLDKLLLSIADAVAEATPERVLYALNIEHIGVRAARQLASRYPSAQQLIDASEAELESLIGTAAAASLHRALRVDPTHRNMRTLLTRLY